MSDTTRYGMIGCGMMGHEHLRNIALLDKAKVTVIFEPDATMAASALATATGARRVETLADLLAQNDIDSEVLLVIIVMVQV